jgi:hypothetical protein
MQDPKTFERAQRGGRAPNEICFEVEVQQGKNIIHAAANTPTLERLILSTLSHTSKWSHGELTHNLHFDAKATFTTYLKTEHPKLAAKTSYLQMGFFLSNYRSFPFVTPRKQEDGTVVVPAMDFPSSKALPWTDETRDTGYFVRALIEPENAGKTMLGYREMLQPEEYVALWGRRLGAKAVAEPLSEKILRDGGLPEFLVPEMLDMAAYACKYGYDGGDPEVRGPEELGVDVRMLGTVEEWLANEDVSALV